MKIAVLMSGGVDSTVAAALLQEEGHELLGLTMRQTDDKAVVEAARSAAEALAIPHQSVDLRDCFQAQVVDYFCREYQRGWTPNPCVECNRRIKFGALLEIARAEGYAHIATGHYVRSEYDAAGKRWYLKKGVDPGKDQSYFLWRLNQEQLGSAVFPLGDWTKERVRAMARERGIRAAELPDSQEICFISKDYRDFLKDRIEAEPGDFVKRSGEVLGRHQGLPWYTVGQRKGLGISAGYPLYVLGLNRDNNQVILGESEELWADDLCAHDINWIAPRALAEGQRVELKIRYSPHSVMATILKYDANGLELRFDQAQRAVTPGQSMVLYDGEYVLGGGVIGGSEPR